MVKTSRREPNPTVDVADPTSVRFQECVCACVGVDGHAFYEQNGDDLAGLHNFFFERKDEGEALYLRVLTKIHE